jgi:hypothetical protein
MNRRSRIYLAGFVLCIAGAAQGESIDAGPFSVDVTPGLMLRYNGVVLFDGDRCDVLRRGLDENDPSPVDAIEQGELHRDGNVLTVIKRQGRNVLRREVMVTPQAVHITFELQVYGSTNGTHLQYELLTPIESLDGVPYDLTKGLLRRPRVTSEETFDFQSVDPFKYIFQTGLYVNLKSPKLDCTIDFNPMGPWIGISNYGDNWATSPYHDGERMRWCMYCSGASNGATFSGKIIIRAGSQPYEAIHPNTPVSYTADFPVALALNFTDSDAHDMYVICPPGRWDDASDVRIVPRAEGGFLRRDFAAGGGDAALDLQLDPGLYLLTLNVYDARGDSGPFTIAGPDGNLVENVTVPRGEYWDKTVPLRVREGDAKLHFSGTWKINALTAQLILRDDEDFLFERPYWNMAVE